MIAEIKFIEAEFSVFELDGTLWNRASDMPISMYWSGEAAPETRQAAARLLWSRAALYVRFTALQNEPLVLSEQPDTRRKTLGLWDRDVCEIYIAPDRSQPNKYFEFEIAPNGEWIDLRLETTSTGRTTDWDYESKMESAARIGNGEIVIAARIPFRSLGPTPKPGEVWLGNLFRCVGAGPGRGYLAWRPTRTAKPNFHVPEAFGEFHFQ